MANIALEKTILLESSDGEKFEVPKAIALMIPPISHIIEDDCIDNLIPLSHVKAKILSLIIDYCKQHVPETKTTEGDDASVRTSFELAKEELKTWDMNFIDHVELDVLHDILIAANYLSISSLLNLATQRVADIIKGKMPEEIREIFKIKNDFEPGEEEEIRRENSWAFE